MPPKRPLYIEEIDELEDIKPHLPINSPNSSNSDDNEELKDIKPIIDRSSPSPKKRIKSNTTTPKRTTPKSSPTKAESGNETIGNGNGSFSASAKARFAEIIIENGLKGYDRNLVESETGLTKNQQIEMLKKGRGSLWKALYSFASTL